MTTVVPPRARLLAALLAAALLVALLPAAALAVGPRTNSEQLPGNTPVAAAIAWSQRTFDGGEAPDVVLGRADRFPDNLASGLLQGTLAAPLLLNPTDRLDADVAAELERLGARTVHILGGGSAISAAVEQELRADGLATHRHAGATRIETAIAVVREHAPTASSAIVSRAFGSPSGDESAAWADALAAGAWAAEENWPVLLTESGQLTASVAEYLRASSIETVTIVGGTQAVSEQAENQLESLGLAVERVSGPNRFDTAVRIAVQRGEGSAASASRVILAEGEEPLAWAGGFAAAAHAERHSAPIVLANGEDLPPETEAYLQPGGSSTALWCGPFTTTAACDAGGALLEQAQTGIVGLEELTVSRDSAIRGDISPMDDVAGMRVEGGCVTGGSVTLGDNGSFAVPLKPGTSAGTCTVVFTVAHDDGRGVDQPFDVTVVAAEDVTEAPQLTAVNLDSGDDEVRYTFDDELRTPASGDAAAFLVYTPDGRRRSATSLALSSDSRTVTATFDGDFLDQATLAAVNSGAVDNISVQPNPAAAFPLQSRSVATGRTDLQDLVGLGDIDKDAATPTTATVEFEFDDDLTQAPADDAFEIALSDGTVIDSSNADYSGDVVTATFTSAALTEYSSASALSDALRRVAAQPGAQCSSPTSCLPPRALDVNGGDLSGRPDLVDVDLLPATHEAVFTFDAQLREPSLTYAVDPNDFVLYQLDGGTVNGDSLTVNRTARTVRVQFPEGTVSSVTMGATVLTGAVESSASGVIDTVGFSGSFPAGEVVGPKAATATLQDDGSVLVTFDRPVVIQMAASGFTGHAASGAALNGSCALSSDGRQARCGFAGSADPVIVSLNAGAVVQQASITAQEANYPQAVRVTS